jgi:hypothetical protein
MEGLERNQNTRAFGKVDGADGVWRDGKGREAPGVMGPGKVRGGWFKGLMGAVRRVRGTGGF